MIKQFAIELAKQIADKDDLVFITGDVGYQSLDPIKKVLGDKFINAGVAEQNMINVAAGMAAEGFKVYVYSIAPFLIYRAYEQIKLNVASRNLDITLIANGGGYGYGVMGPTHHALNDLSVLNGLENIKGYIPSCALDVEKCVEISLESGPKYFRFGLNENNIGKEFKDGFGEVTLNKDAQITVVSLGPLAQSFIGADGIDHFTCFEFPFIAVPNSLIDSLKRTGRLLVVEEHTKNGGVGEKLISVLQKEKIQFEFNHRYANHYENGYGDQEFHKQQNGLDTASLIDLLND